MIITNNTEITIKNIRTGKTTTILKTDPNAEDRVTGKVVAGIPFIDTIDDSLDSFVVQLKDYEKRDLFKPFDFVVFTVNDGLETVEKKYFVMFDDVQTYSQLRKTYVHNLSLVEPTKILEKTKIFNLNLTNQSNTLFDQLLRVRTNAETVFYNLDKEYSANGTPIYKKEARFNFATPLYEFTRYKASRDFYFSNTDLRSVLDEMLGAYNARVTVEDVVYDDDTGDIYLIYFGYRDMTKIINTTPTWTEGEQGKPIFEHVANDGQNTAGTIVARGYNSIAEEPIVFTDMFKSQSATLTSTTAAAFLPFPISEKGFEQFEIWVTAGYYHKLSGQDVTETEQGVTVEHKIKVDLSDRLIPFEQYNLLSLAESKKYLPYQIGQKMIEFGQTYSKWYGATIPVVSDILKEKAKKIVVPGFVTDEGEEYEEGIFEYLLNVGFYTYPFTCSYYPLIDTVASVSKPNTYDKDDLLIGIMDSQTEQTLDIDRHGKKLSGLIKRTGNAEYYLDVKAKYYSKLLPLMSKIDLPEADSDDERGFVLYKREYSIFDNFINCRYYFSKDFNAVQQNAGVNREKHLFDIPLESDETPIIVKKYLVFSTYRGYGGGFETSLPIAAANTLLGKNISTDYTAPDSATTKTAGGKLKYLLFQAQGTTGIYPQNTENSSGEYPYKSDESYRFALPICSYALNKTMTFMANCLDNYSVGYSRDGYVFSIWGDGGNKVTYNRYVDKSNATIGEAHKFELDFAFEWKYEAFDFGVKFEGEDRSDWEKATASITHFPVAKNTDFISCGLAVAPLYVEYFKDRTQTPLFVLMLECIPSKADYGDLIIGTEFARKNNLVRDNGDGLTGLRLYMSDTLTFNGDENLLSSEYMENEPQDVSSFFNVEEYSYSGGRGAVLKSNGTAAACASWAIADERGNIFLAANGSVRDIYVSVSNFPY